MIRKIIQNKLLNNTIQNANILKMKIKKANAIIVMDNAFQG